MRPMYLEIADYVVDNDASKTQVCKNFAITKRMLKDHLRNLREYDYFLYLDVMSIFDENPSVRGDLPKYLSVTQYIQNVKPDRYDVCKRFGMTNKNLYDSLRYLDRKNSKLANKVKNILG